MILPQTVQVVMKQNFWLPLLVTVIGAVVGALVAWWLKKKGGG